MGKGDKRTFKGKVFKGSFGKSRPRSKKKTTHSTVTAPRLRRRRSGS
jgi:30S ribosomal protein S31